MLAGVNLKKFQGEKPLGADGDRVATLFAQLIPLQEPKLEARRRAGSLIAGEVNRNTPNAKTFHYLDDSHAIVVFSKLIDFYEIASNILFGGANIDGDHLPVRGPDSMSDTVGKLEALFRCWTPEGLADDLPSQISLSPLSPEAAGLATFQSDSSLLFLISHELGHVLYYRAPTENDGKNDSILTQEQELQSDVTGMQSLLRSAQSPADARIRIAGVFAAMRVLAVFGALGHAFGGGHPAPLARLQVLLDYSLKFCKTERDFWSLTPVAYAVDQKLEAAGFRALGKMDRPARTADRMFSALSSVIENVAKGWQPASEVLVVMNYDFEHAPRPNLEQLAQIAARMFPPTPTQTESPSQDALWAKKAEIFRSLRDQWPEPMAEMFRNAYDNLYRPGGVS
jgi:hypothetical protein